VDSSVVDYLRTKRIDSFQKLRLLLFLYQHPEVKATQRELGEQLYLGDTPLLTTLLTDLDKAGLLEQGENGYRLRNEPDITQFVQDLVWAFEHPVTRLEILNHIKAGVSSHPVM
jgi:hypothetical protein